MLVEVINNMLYVLEFIIVSSLCFGLNSKLTIKKISTFMVTISITTVILYFIDDIIFKMPLSLLCVIGTMYLLYDERRGFLATYTVSMTAALSLINQISNMIVLDIINMMNGEITDIPIYDTYKLIVSIIFLFIIGIIVKQKSPKGLRTLGWRYIILFSTLLIVDSVVVLFLGELAIGSFKMSTLYEVMYILVVIGIFVQIGLVILLILSRNIYREKEILTKKYLNEQMEHYTYLENRERETKKFRHDLRNHMHMLTILYKQQNYEEFDKYMEEINGRIDQFGNRISVGNGIVDAVLNKFYNEAMQKGILVKVEGHFPMECRVCAYDLCTIFSNLLSNAVRAEEECAGKEIGVRCRYTDTEIMLIVENDYEKILRNENGKLQTSKLDTFSHGFGLENVAECVERNQGYMSIQTKEKQFRVILSLNNRKSI